MNGLIGGLELKNIKAIIFDVDETLVDRKASFIQFCNYLIDRYESENPYIGTRDELIEYMVEIDENGYGGLENFLPRLGRLWKLPLTVEAFIQERNEVFGKMTTPFPELYEVLDTLKGRYRLGVITNGYSSVQREKLRTVGITDYFDDIIVSGEQAFAKPDPRIFQMSLENLGISREEAVYIGDYYPNDIAGAIGAGIKSIWINDDPTEHPEYEGIRVDRLQDILPYFVSLS
jgi:putative hydrolase of the HAD superfamily